MKCLLSVNDGEQINVTKKVFKVPLHSALRFFFPSYFTLNIIRFLMKVSRPNIAKVSYMPE